MLKVLKEGTVVDAVQLSTTRALIVGRLPTVDIPLHHGSISRHHATLEITESGLCNIKDLDSTHGTFVNCQGLGKIQRVVGNCQLQNGDTVRFGESSREFLFLATQQKSSSGFSFSANQVSVKRRQPTADVANSGKKLEQKLIICEQPSMSGVTGLNPISLDSDEEDECVHIHKQPKLAKLVPFVVYPSKDDRDSVSIVPADMERLKEGNWLNDNLVDYYLKVN
jgi:pSer/pThr/pTyr-binding forkhead associated (FHA) protein